MTEITGKVSGKYGGRPKYFLDFAELLMAT